MGFDALANGLALTDITYRILLIWKRRTSRHKQIQVDMLCEALKVCERKKCDMGDCAGEVPMFILLYLIKYEPQ